MPTKKTTTIEAGKTEKPVPAKTPAKNITRRPQAPKNEPVPVSEKAIERFIESAPDSQVKVTKEDPNRIVREKISLNIPVVLLAEVDALARKKNLTRVSLITVALTEYVATNGK